jgi:hypothetical protein
MMELIQLAKDAVGFNPLKPTSFAMMMMAFIYHIILRWCRLRSIPRTRTPSYPICIMSSISSLLSVSSCEEEECRSGLSRKRERERGRRRRKRRRRRRRRKEEQEKGEKEGAGQAWFREM